eukprot:2481042-Prymnesium_polylepis.1
MGWSNTTRRCRLRVLVSASSVTHGRQALVGALDEDGHKAYLFDARRLRSYLTKALKRKMLPPDKGGHAPTRHTIRKSRRKA